MNWLIVVVLAAVALTAQAFTDEQKAKLQGHFDHCVAETGADKDVIRSARKDGLVDAKLMAYYHCMMKRMGFQGEDGALHTDVMVSKLPPGADKAKLTEAINKCAEGHGHHSKEETAYFSYKCFRENMGDQSQFFAFN